jgi:hypothetical protein
VRLLFIPLNEKSPQRKTFCGCGRGEEKMTQALRDFSLQEFQDCFEKWKTHLDSALHQMDITLKEIQFVTPKYKCTIFYYKFPVSFGSPYTALSPLSLTSLLRGRR